jgi:hypothetical protein
MERDRRQGSGHHLTMSHIFTGFDCETAPIPSAVERFTKPFPGFVESEVKTGNLKDPLKIAAKLAEARDTHADEKVAYWKRAHDFAACNPFTGRIVVIGLVNEEGSVSYIEGDEKTILTLFWMHYSAHGDAARKFVFWSGCGASEKNFDIDFIVTRSRINGVRIPPGVRQGRFYSPRIVDLAGEFLLHQREQYLSLTKAAELFGLYDDTAPGPKITPKRDDDTVTGESFHAWYAGTAVDMVSAAEQRAHALTYLKNDLLHLVHLADRIL